LSLLGIDLGTSGIKCIAYNTDGKMLAKAYREYHLHTPEPQTAELDPHLVWESFCENVIEINHSDQLKKDPVRALSISVSADEALPIDKKGNILYNTIMSMDKRGAKENRYINDLLGKENIYRITGMSPAPLYALNRLLWFKNNKKDIFEKTYKYLCWEDFIFFKLGAEPATDYSVASRTLAFDIHKKHYSDTILDKVGINMEIFPDAFPSGTVVGTVEQHVASALHMRKDVKIVTGGFDQCCAALGAGVVDEPMVSVGTGTMEVMQICLDKPIINNDMLHYGYSYSPHVVDDKFICITLNFNGGIIFKWYRDNLASTEKDIAKNKHLKLYDVIMDSAQDSKFPLLFLPYFEGAQTPLNDPDIPGVLFGLTLRTKKEDIIKSFFEGITFDLKLNLQKIEKSSIAIEKIRATGGGARSDIWLQHKADITGKIIQKIDNDESGCMAAAVLSGCGIKEYDSLTETINSRVRIVKEFYPDPAKYVQYEEKFQKFVQLYRILKDFKI
jgi:xylulokinase